MILLFVFCLSNHYFFSNLFDLPFSVFQVFLFIILVIINKKDLPLLSISVSPLTDFSFCSTSFLCCLHPRLFSLTSHFTLSIILQVAYSHFTKPIFHIFKLHSTCHNSDSGFHSKFHSFRNSFEFILSFKSFPFSIL